MKKTEGKLRNVIKGCLKVVSSACVDACIAGGAAAVIPITMINPVIGVMIVTGAAVASAAMCESTIDPYVERKVDQAAERIKETREEVNNCIEDIKAEDEKKNSK